MDAIEITLPGLPRGKGRPRFAKRGKFVKVYTDEQTQSYEGALRLAGSIAMAGREPLVCALSLEMVAVFPIPASWSKRKQADAVAGAIRPTGRPDCDNIMKVCDGLNAIVWKDDAQIVRATITKRYGTTPELSIVVRDHTA